MAEDKTEVDDHLDTWHKCIVLSIIKNTEKTLQNPREIFRKHLAPILQHVDNYLSRVDDAGKKLEIFLANVDLHLLYNMAARDNQRQDDEDSTDASPRGNILQREIAEISQIPPIQDIEIPGEHAELVRTMVAIIEPRLNMAQDNRFIQFSTALLAAHNAPNTKEPGPPQEPRRGPSQLNTGAQKSSTLPEDSYLDGPQQQMNSGPTTVFGPSRGNSQGFLPNGEFFLEDEQQ